MAMAANKIAGVRAAPAQSEDEVHMTREHNDANVLTLGAKYLDEERALDLIHVFLNTEFAGGRHARRVAKIAQLEHSVTGERLRNPEMQISERSGVSRLRSQHRIAEGQL